MVRILAVPLSVCCHIHSCVVLKYCAQYHCLFTAYFGAFSRGLASWGPRINGTPGGSVGIPQGDAHKSLTHHKQQIFSHRIEGAVSLTSLPLKIGLDIDLVCPTSSFFANIVIESSWMGAIWRPCHWEPGEEELSCCVPGFVLVDYFGIQPSPKHTA